jgi:lipopolysaccharide/colanic/teichoic acid biosynthesis glycosyltransferase
LTILTRRGTNPVPYPGSSRAEPAWLFRFRPEERLVRGRPYLVAKRALDLLLLLLTWPLWVPLLGLVALVIKLETPRAPVLFAQPRTGRNGRRFRMYKFRTMVVNAEALKKHLAYLNELPWPDFKIADDPRITPVGRYLRQTSLDELPQLWNVIRGEMSLVGPRPTSFAANTYALWQTERLDIQPGITGLWQVAGRGETDFDDRLRLDIAYMERRSLALDVHLLFRTIAAVLGQRGAR